MLRSRPALLLLLLALSAIPAGAGPLQITGRVLHPPEDVQVELRPWSVEHAEALRRLKGAAVPPLAVAKPGAEGSFALQVPDRGFYAVVVRAEGRLALERFARFVVEDVELPAVELPPASPLQVKAVGPGGQPLAGVTIQAIPLQPESGEWRAAERRGVTDAEGRTVFPHAAGEALTLVVTTPGRYTTASTSPTGASQTVRFPAQRSRTVEFRTPDGKPAAGALVRLARRGWPYGLTGEDGRIALPVSDREEIGFVAEDSQGLRAEVVLRQDEETPVFTLRSPASVSGWVHDASTHEPIAGALVWNGSFGGMAWTRTDAAGAFALLAPAGGRGQVEATAAGRTLHAEPWTRDRNDPITLHLALRGSAVAVGRVVDEEGVPLAGARATLVTGGTGAPLFQATSDSDGRFRFLGVMPGWFFLRVERQGFASAAVSDVPIPEEEPRVDLGEVRLRAGGAIEGVVTDARGRPVEKARIQVRPHDLHGPVLSGPDGRFRIEDLPLGTRFELEVEASGLLPAEVAGVEVPTARPLRIRLDLLRTLSGRVVDQGGAAVAGASIQGDTSTVRADGSTRTMVGRPVKADSEGRFVLPNLSPGRVDVQAGAPGYQSGRVPVEVPEDGEAEPVEIVLQPGTSLEGTVLDNRGLPVQQAQVYSRCQREPQAMPSGGTTDSQGRYEILDLEPGPCEVEAFFKQGRRLTTAVELQPGRNRLDLRLPAGAEISGRVVDSRGEPLPGASVFLQRGLDDPGPLQAMSSADGSFTFAHVMDGEYRLTASRSGFGLSTHPGEIRVEGAPVTGLELRLPRGAVIRGRILGFRPEELRSASVQSSSEGIAFALPGTVSPRGAYRIDEVTPGEWQVVARIPPDITLEGTVEVPAEAAEVVLDLEHPPGFTLTGRVLLDREPLPGAGVRAVDPASSFRRQGKAGQDGTFRLERLPAGSYVLWVELPGSIDFRALEVGGDLDVTVEISTGAVEGRVLASEGLPVSGAVVVLIREIPRLTTEPGPAARSDDRGAFEIPQLPAGTYRMRVLAEGFAPAESRIVVAPGGTLHIDVALGASQ